MKKQLQYFNNLPRYNMKNLLLTLFLALAAITGHAQATAYPVPDLNQCGYEIFDLTAQNATALGNQDPEIFFINYFTTEADAQANANAIANPTAFVPVAQPETVYLSVTNATTGDFDITSFELIVSQGPNVGFFNDVTACQSYTLPALIVGNYFTGPNGTGTALFPGMAISNTQTVYVYSNNGTCTSENSFTVTIGTINVGNHPDVTTCFSYVLPVAETGNYYSGPGGSGVIIPAGTAVTSTQTIYIYAVNGSCTGEDSFTVTIMNAEDVVIPPNAQVSCDPLTTGFSTFNLENAAAEFTSFNPDVTDIAFYLTQQDAYDAVNAIENIFAFMNTMPGQQTIYLNFVLGDCAGTVPMELITIPCEGTSTLSGIVTLDDEGDGCDAGDGPAAGIMVSYNSGNYVYNTFTDVNGNYTFYNVPDGVVSLWIQNINGQGFTSNPSAITLTLPDDNSSNNFCVSVPAPFTDVAVYIMPGSQAVPGFGVVYYVATTNYGTTTASGTTSFTFNDALLSGATTTGGTVTGNTVTWNYTNLLPYQTIYNYISFVVATPPTVVSGTVLNFTASVTPVSGDVNLDNNTYNFTQWAVNSFDPNDITIQEGEYITEQQADGFLHYTIRFQNTGTANAQNVKVSLPLDENLDWNTFQPIGASHVYHANRTMNVVDFMFDNIQLPFEDANEAGSHGFVSFRIKPVSDIAVGESAAETAYIYFDFNEAIVTNTATTTVQSAAGVKGFGKDGLVLYPNPTSTKVTLQLANATEAQVTVADVLGKKVMEANVTGGNAVLDVASLKAGIYFVTVSNGSMQTTKKLIVE